MDNEKQTSLHNEYGWNHCERLPHMVEPKPELELAWRGLLIVIGEGQMTRTQAVEMLRRWDEEDAGEPA